MIMWKRLWENILNTVIKNAKKKEDSIMKGKFSSGMVFLLLSFSWSSYSDPGPGESAFWKEDFSVTHLKDNLLFPKGWELRTKMGTPASSFFIVKDAEGKNILNVKSDKSTGTLLKTLSGKVDLKKTPVIKWTWKASVLPQHGDGRYSDKDDQAIALYVGTGRFRQQSVAYRWETDTPLGSEGNVNYGAGMVKVKWYCVRNKDNELEKWYVEERNIAEDFKKAYGFLPDEIAVSLVSNSQYTKSQAEAQVGWIEFISIEKTPEKKEGSL